MEVLRRVGKVLSREEKFQKFCVEKFGWEKFTTRESLSRRVLVPRESFEKFTRRSFRQPKNLRGEKFEKIKLVSWKVSKTRARIFCAGIKSPAETFLKRPLPRLFTPVTSQVSSFHFQKFVRAVDVISTSS